MAQDIVDLRIEAENLASERLIKAAEDVQGLGRTAEQAQKQVEQLEITRDSLNSFDQASNRIDELQTEVAQAETQYKKLREEIRKSKDVTDDQTTAMNRQNQVVKQLRGDLRQAESEYRKIDASLRQAGVNTRAFTVEQERLNTELVQARTQSEKLSDTYEKQVATLRERVNEQKEAVAQTKKETAEQEKLTDKIEEQNRQRKLAVEAARQEAIANKELEQTIVRYERELARLNEEKSEGNITTGQYIRSEAALRKQLQLTSTQVTTSRRAIEADVENKEKSSRATDALTTVTRRLAQAYTVLIAAQTAAQAAIGNVQEYGKLESAIVNIERTTGLAADQVTGLADEIIDLSKNVTPTATSELLKFAEVAGQLGVNGTADILNLVAAADQLGVATNIAGDEAATLLTRILQTTGEGVPSIQNLASTVVQLGNNFATTESEIVNFTRNIVTATRDINLSSAGAAALGTALSVTGLQAEASRTAIGRLSQTIRRAATEGGNSLEALANITGMTADQIEENLGERSEQIILAFVEGLAKMRDEGAVTLDVLRRFGIDGQEAAQVFGGLASQVDTLRDAINQSNDAYAAGNAQVIEAARAFATQESAVGRLSNTFTALRANIGEAFSDETDVLIRRMTENINGAEQSLIDLFEIIPDVVSGFDDLVDTVENLTSIIGTDLGGAFDGVIEGFTIFGNAITAGLNTLVLAAQTTQLAFAEFGASVSEYFGGEPNTELLDTLRARVEETKNDILRDSDDMAAALDRLAGTSSRRYEDLIDATERYKGAITSLTDEQQAQLQQILDQNRYIPENEQAYQDLTAALVRANRQKEIEAELNERNRELAERAREAAEKEREAKEKVAETLGFKNDKTREEIDLSVELKDRIAELNERYRQGKIDATELVNQITLLNTQYDEQNAKILATKVNRESEIEATKGLITEIASLVQQYRDGEITLEQYNQRQSELEVQLNRTNAALVSAAQTTSYVTREQANLQVEINKTQQNVVDLTYALEQQGLTEQEIIDTTAKLRAETEKLNALKEEEVRLNEISNASYAQLQQQREQAVQQLEQLRVQYESGAITTGEYQVRQKQLSETISELNTILGENTEGLEENTEAVQKNTTAVTKQGQAVKQATDYTNLYGQAHSYLNQEFDFSNQTTDDLNKRMRTLQGNIVNNNKVTSIWWRELAQLNNQGFEREKQLINETLLLRRYTNAVQNGNLSLEQLNNISRAASANIRTLGDNQLEPLRNAIADAKREFQDLNESIDDALNDTLDRLDEISGNQEEIVKRRYAEEIKQYEELLRLAQASGDAAAVNRAQQALRNLRRAQELEFEQEFGNNSNNNTTSNNTTNNTTSSNTTPTQTYRVQLELPDGGTTSVNVADQASAASLLEVFESLGEVSQDGA